MAQKLPPTPVGVPPGHSFWNDWYERLRTIVNNISSLTWSIIDFTGSNLTDIVTRNHNDLQNLQGGGTGDYNHVTSAQLSSIAQAGLLVLNSKAGDPTTSDISSGTAKLYKNTSTSAIKLWVNDGGTMKSVQLL